MTNAYQLFLNTPIVTEGNIFFCDPAADIVVNANMRSTAGSIYILGKTLYIKEGVKLESSRGEIVAKGEEDTCNKGWVVAPRGIAIVGGGIFPIHFTLPGPHISSNLEGRIQKVQS